MNKEMFLDSLRNELFRARASMVELGEILNDYNQLIDEAIEGGMDEGKFISGLGNPNELVLEIKTNIGGFQKNRASDFTLGIKPSALKDGKLFLDFIFIIAFIMIGLITNDWHPTWVILLFGLGVLFSKGGKNVLEKIQFSALFFTPATYVLLDHYFDNPYLGLFSMVLPVISILNKNYKQILTVALLGLTVILGLNFGVWVFIGLSTVLFIIQTLNIDNPIDHDNFGIFVFLILGMNFSMWHPGWIVLVIYTSSKLVIRKKGK